MKIKSIAVDGENLLAGTCDFAELGTIRLLEIEWPGGNRAAILFGNKKSPDTLLLPGQKLEIEFA